MPTTNYPPHADSSGFVSGLMIGLVAGAAGAHFLQNTEKGRELFEKLKEKAGDALESIKDNPALLDKLDDLQRTMDQARAVVNNAASHVADATTPVSEATNKKSFFQRHGLSLGK